MFHVSLAVRSVDFPKQRKLIALCSEPRVFFLWEAQIHVSCIIWISLCLQRVT